MGNAGGGHELVCAVQFNLLDETTAMQINRTQTDPRLNQARFSPDLWQNRHTLISLMHSRTTLQGAATSDSLTS